MFRTKIFALLLVFLAGALAEDPVQSYPHLTNATTKTDCKQRYTPGCANSDVSGIMRLLSKVPPVEILPGVTISTNPDRRNASSLDSFSDLLKSLTLHVSVYNDDAVSYVYSKLSEPLSASTGRGKKFKFLSIYTVFAIAFALLSALVGKAMTLSIVSLVMAMLTRNLIGNSPPASPVYDIVRRPQVNYQSEGFWTSTGAEDPNRDPEPPFPNPFEQQQQLLQQQVVYQQAIDGARAVGKVPKAPENIHLVEAEHESQIQNGHHS